MAKSLQELHGPGGICFGCGPANDKGLRIRSFVADDGGLVAHWRPEPHHRAFGNAVNGGICGALLDCHGNWCAAHALWEARGGGELPATVTARFEVTLRRPTPADRELVLRARAVNIDDPKVDVEASIEVDGEVTVTMRALFVAVTEGHPAWHRWGA